MLRRALLSLWESLENADADRVESARDEIDFASKHKDWTTVIEDALSDKSIPVRVTHNDVKLNNVLFRADTSKAFALVGP